MWADEVDTRSMKRRYQMSYLILNKNNILIYLISYHTNVSWELLSTDIGAAITNVAEKNA